MTLTAVLIGGGQSRRMGLDKAAVLIAGQPLWQRQLQVVRALEPSTIWVSARAVPAWLPPELDAVLDEAPSRGPLSGVAAALRRLDTSHLLVLAVDLPQMTAAHLLYLWSQARPGVGIVPQQGEWFEPLCAVYPAEAARAADKALSGRDSSLQGFVRKLQAQARIESYRLEPADEPLYLNMNTPADIPSPIPS
jgi:molybdopterin-guanine dinucleotide biosynthesis protein A